nr:lytic murein transglycosylase [Afipia sp.]
VAALFAMTLFLIPQSSRAADAGFTNFVASLWPEAQKAGVSRAMFDARMRALQVYLLLLLPLL